MTTTQNPAILSAIEKAIRRIPPLWPLRNFVAVNPFLGFTHLPFPEACALLQRTVGGAPVLSPREYLEAYRLGEITDEHLGIAKSEELESQLKALSQSPIPVGPILTVADLLDEQRPHAHWSVFITEEISKWCTVRFDENQTTWQSPWRGEGMYASWRKAAIFDRNPEAFGIAGFREFVASLPQNAYETIAQCLETLITDAEDPTEFLHRQLVTVHGWAGYLQFLSREEQMRGRKNQGLTGLMAIRLAYDAALFRVAAKDESFLARWNVEEIEDGSSSFAALAAWQSAFECGYQQRLAAALLGQPSQGHPTRPGLQVIFCIDVRSEIFRRHLESASSDVQTIGFAGFFGFPVAHTPWNADASEARCPVLLVPPVETFEAATAEEALAERLRNVEKQAWKAFQNSAASCFSFVETAGLFFGTALGKRQTKPDSCRHSHAPGFAPCQIESKTALVDMAEGALRNMSLVKNFARLVLICGHGSESANNPYKSSMDCGACGGHSGDVNARLAASTLNRPSVRAELSQRGIEIPANTWFMAGLHNTTTDEVMVFDTGGVPATHAADLESLRIGLNEAGAATRASRASRLGLASESGDTLLRKMQRRSTDISQTRPEWGLANNAALVAAPRSRTARLNLSGRVFLHDYDAGADQGNAVLTLILCAPVVVASWINLQYYASRVQPELYGSGNKTLHNVAGGIGIFEGNSGDLRAGLPIQSIHDGTRFTHEPRRLSVFIEALREDIEAVLADNPGVKDLFVNGWIHLFALETNSCFRYCEERWEAFAIIG